MHYKQQIVINQPVDRVVELFDDPDNMKKWFPGFQSFEHISGEPGEVGAKSRMVFKSGRGSFELIETITVKNLPEEFSGTYDTVGKGIYNTMTNRFVPLDSGSTRYETEIGYRFSGIMFRLMSLFMRPLFKRQSFKVMKLFKEFAESQPAAVETATANTD